MSKSPKKKNLSFADRLKAWRSAKGLTQLAAAKELNVSERTLEGWESSRWEPRLKTAMSIFAHLAKDGH